MIFKKTITILLIVGFLLSLAVTSVSASHKMIKVALILTTASTFHYIVSHPISNF